MKTSYIAPQTEVYFINPKGYFLDNDSGGDIPSDSPDIGANSFSFDEGTEDSSTKGIWED